MRRLIIAALVGGLLLSILASSTSAVHASRYPARLASASELIQYVNQLRAANGLAPYRVNSALMAAAQSHSDYQAATGTTSHTGKGGSRPRDRAVAYGYGGGAAVYVSENIATGTSLSASEVVGWWQGDNLHLTTMLSSKYTDVGAGAAEANGVVYYTLDVGYVAGEEGQPPAPPPQQGSTPGGGTGNNPAPAGTPVAAVVPIQASTPRADGSIVHEVQPGQALWNIAAVYKVGLSYLIVLNGLSENALIYPGDKLLIRPPDPTPTPLFSITPPPTSTLEVVMATESAVTTPFSKNSVQQAGIEDTPKAPSPTVEPHVLAQAPLSEDSSVEIQGQAAAEVPANSKEKSIDPILILIGLMVALGTGLLLFGSLIGRQK
jgi:LysM repeat protein